MKPIIWVVALVAVKLAESAPTSSDNESSTAQPANGSGSPLSGLNLDSLIDAINNVLNVGSNVTGGVVGNITSIVNSPYMQKLWNSFLDNPTLQGLSYFLNELFRRLESATGVAIPLRQVLSEVLRVLISPPIPRIPKIPSLPGVPSIPPIGGL